MTSPFVVHDGRPFLVANFTLDADAPRPSLHDLLAELLEQHSASDLLLLRPLSRAEAAELEQTVEDAEVDFWARLVGAK